jgi:hypothetical protein
MLLRRQKLPALQMIEYLVGMQAQAPDSPYVGLWTRLEGFHPDELARLILDRRAVRIALMRNTVHLVSARDCLELRPLVQSVIDRGLYANRAHRTSIEGVDIEALAATGRSLLEERPHTAKELGEILWERWPERDPASLARAIRHLVPLVQVPPRGVWGKRGPAAHTTAEAWAPRRSRSALQREPRTVFFAPSNRGASQIAGLSPTEECVDHGSQPRKGSEHCAHRALCSSTLITPVVHQPTRTTANNRKAS